MKLVTVLLLIMVMTWLWLSSTETHWLTIKMSDYFSDKIITFEAAEAGLSMQEAVIQHQTMVLPPMAAKIVTSIKLIDEDQCHRKRYQIFSDAVYRKAKVLLESIYDYLPEPSPACSAEKINQRVFWSER